MLAALIPPFPLIPLIPLLHPPLPLPGRLPARLPLPLRAPVTLVTCPGPVRLSLRAAGAVEPFEQALRRAPVQPGTGRIAQMLPGICQTEL